MPKTDRTSKRDRMPVAPTTTASPDPALSIGLILAFTRQGRGGVASVPDPLLRDLTGLREAGDPAATLVSQWIADRATPTGEAR